MLSKLDITVSFLLIVPRGIEIRESSTITSCPLLLIVPRGIEMYQHQPYQTDYVQLLIVPRGIEITLTLRRGGVILIF